jgi:hypothetical protein
MKGFHLFKEGGGDSQPTWCVQWHGRVFSASFKIPGKEVKDQGYHVVDTSGIEISSKEGYYAT